MISALSPFTVHRIRDSIAAELAACLSGAIQLVALRRMISGWQCPLLHRLYYTAAANPMMFLRIVVAGPSSRWMIFGSLISLGAPGLRYDGSTIDHVAEKCPIVSHFQADDLNSDMPTDYMATATGSTCAPMERDNAR